MNLPLAIAVILSQFAIPPADRDEPNRNDRLTVIATSIARASWRATCTGEFATAECKPIASDANMVAAELTELANSETALRSNVHRGDCGPHQCDATRLRTKDGVLVIHRARSLWQLHKAPTWSLAKWASLLGDTQQATDAAAWEATKLLAGYRGTCGGTDGAFAGYATGAKCTYRAAKSRAKRAENIRDRLVRLQVNEAEVMR